MHTKQFSIKTILFLTSCLFFLASCNPSLITSKDIFDNKSKLNFSVCEKEPPNINANNLSVTNKDASSNIVIILVVALFFILVSLSFYFKLNPFKAKNSIEEKLKQPTWF